MLPLSVKTSIDGTEDTAITFTQDMLLQNATDVDSDTLTAINLDIDPQYGDLEGQRRRHLYLYPER